MNAAIGVAGLPIGSPLRVHEGLAALRHAVWLALTLDRENSWPDPARATPARGAGRATVGRAPAGSGYRRPVADPVPPARRYSGTGTVPPPGDPDPHPHRGHDHPTDVWDLVERAKNGDTEAFGRIYDQYVDVVFKFVYFRVSSRSLAEDLTSETFLRALRRIGTVSWQGRDLGAWFITIARNLVADHYKSGRFRLEVSTADMRDADREEHGLEGAPEAAVLERLTNATLLEAIRKLSAEQQECIALRFLQGLSVTETAEVMGKNEGAIKALQYRAVRSLGRLLPDGFVP